MGHRDKIPPGVADDVLGANRHTCCICRTPRKHVQLHHIDGDPSNNAPWNIAVLCLDCHSRVTGNEGLGRRFSQREVARYKTEWEAGCSNSEADPEDAEEPVRILRRSFLVQAGEHAHYDFELDQGEELIVTISADRYIDVSICNQADYRRWMHGEELDEYEGEEDVRDCELSFVAPRLGTYCLLIINEGHEDADVAMDAAVWESCGRRVSRIWHSASFEVRT